MQHNIFYAMLNFSKLLIINARDLYCTHFTKIRVNGINERFTMNKKIITIIALALAFPLTVAAFPGGHDGGGRHRGNKVEYLAKQLDLNAEQKSKLEVIFKEQQEKREALRQETRLRMQEVLTAEQMTKLDAMKKDRQEKWQKRHEERKNKEQSETKK